MSCPPQSSVSRLYTAFCAWTPVFYWVCVQTDIGVPSLIEVRKEGTSPKVLQQQLLKGKYSVSTDLNNLQRAFLDHWCWFFRKFSESWQTSLKWKKTSLQRLNTLKETILGSSWPIILASVLDKIVLDSIP